MLAYIPLILFVVTTNAVSQALLKKGMIGIGAFDVSDDTMTTILRIVFDPWVIGGLVVMAISMAGHLYVLSRVPLTFAFPFIALSYILVMFIGYYFFSEQLNINHFIGMTLIIFGLIFIGRAGDLQNQNTLHATAQMDVINE